MHEKFNKDQVNIIEMQDGDVEIQTPHGRDKDESEFSRPKRSKSSRLCNSQIVRLPEIKGTVLTRKVTFLSPFKVEDWKKTTFERAKHAYENTWKAMVSLRTSMHDLSRKCRLSPVTKAVVLIHHWSTKISLWGWSYTKHPVNGVVTSLLPSPSPSFGYGTGLVI